MLEFQLMFIRSSVVTEAEMSVKRRQWVVFVEDYVAGLIVQRHLLPREWR